MAGATVHRKGAPHHLPRVTRRAGWPARPLSNGYLRDCLLKLRDSPIVGDSKPALASAVDHTFEGSLYAIHICER